MENKKVTPSTIKEAIIEKAVVLKRKKELYENVQKIEGELKTLNESLNESMIGTFGFAHAADRSNITKTGFVNDFQNISNIARLESEMNSTIKEEKTMSEELMNEFTKLKEEVENLKKENAELKKTKETKK